MRISIRISAAAVLALCASAASAQRPLDAVHAVFEARQAVDYAAAVGDYLVHVERAGTPDASPDLARDLAQLALVVPDELVDRLAAPDPALGRDLAAWWRRQDPLPSTPLNERALEHLLRVATARESFGSGDDAGFDARGETLVRFGPPTRRRVIDVESDLFIARAIREESAIRRSDFPRNEAWHYPALGPDVYFLFVERRGRYEDAEPVDLLPRALWAGGMSYETVSRARLLGQTIRWIYKDLHTYSADIRNRTLTFDAAVGGDGVAFEGNTALVIQNEFQRARQADAIAREARDAALPEASTSVRSGPFGVARRTAVFLDGPVGEGPLSVWAGWAPIPSQLAGVADSLLALGLSPEQYLIAQSALALGPGYEREEEQRAAVPAQPARTVWSIADAVPLGGHAAFEWDLYPADDAGQIVPPGAVAADVLWIDSVDVAQAGDVALSGLLPVDVDRALALNEPDRYGGLPPPRTPGPIGTGESVAVYFEVYGRRPGVEVQIEVRAVQVRAGRILRRGAAVATGSSVRATLDEPRRPELAVVDVADLEGADELRIEVVVTDLDADVRVRQSVTFDV